MIISLLLAIYIALKPLYLSNSGQMQIADTFLAFVFIYMLPYLFQYKFWNIRRVRHTLMLFVILCLYQAVVNVLWSRVLSDTEPLIYTLYYVFNLLAFTVVLRICLHAGVSAVMKSIAIGGMVSLIICLLGVSSGVVAGAGGFRVVSFFNNPNQLGYHCLIVLTVLLYCMDSGDLKVSITTIPCVLAMGLIMASGSKAAIFSSIFLIFLYIIFECLVQHSITKTQTLLLISILLLILWLLLFSRSSFFESNDILLTIRRRVHNALSEGDSSLGVGRGYNRIYEMNGHYIFGMGEGAFYRFASLPGIEVHSTYVSLFVSYGVIGALGYLALFVMCIWNKDTWCSHLVLLSGILLYQFTHNGIRNTIVWILLATILCRNLDLDENRICTNYPRG